MSYLSNIPQAIFNNILLLGILWMAYQFAEQVLKLGTKKLFVLAVAIQTIASGLFLLDVFTAHSNSIISFQINPINSIILSPTNPLFIYIGVIYLIGLFLYLIHFMIQVNKLHFHFYLFTFTKFEQFQILSFFKIDSFRLFQSICLLV